MTTDATGWFVDPFDEHEHRWFSQGAPTRLVRDAGVESYATPPEEHGSGPLVPAVTAHDDRSGAEQLRRAGHHDPSDRYDPAAAAAAALDSGAASGLGFS